MLLVLVLTAAAVPPVSRLDAVSTWARTYRGDASVIGTGAALLAGGDIIATGTLGGRLLVTRLSPEGDVRWSNTYGQVGEGGVTPGADLNVVRAIPCAPGGVLAFWGPFIVRINDSGTVRWAHQYKVYTPSDAFRVTQFTGAAELPDGGYAVCGRTFNYRIFLCKLTRDGSLVWAKAYALHGSLLARVFAVPGGGLLLGATSPPAEVTGTQTVKLMWLNADGKVQRSLVYEDTTTPTSSYGNMINMTMTSTGPVLAQHRYSEGCGGTNVVKLDTAGAVQWTTWVGGLRKGMATVDLHAIDEAADSSLLLVGETTEFSEHDDYGYDGAAMKLTPQGDVAWLSTVDRGVFVPSNQAGDVAATDDGGMAWVSTSNREASYWDALVIRMGPDGTAGKLGNYLTQVDIGNARLVRIEHPAVTATSSTRTSEAVTCDVSDIDVPPSDAGLTGSEVEGTALATLTLRPLYPADSATPSSIMQGGTMYRYYTVLDAEGKTVKGAELRYYNPFSGTTVTATSDEHGEIAFSFTVPRNEEPQHWDKTLTIDRVRVNGLRSVLSSRPDFATDVLPLSWSTNWMMGNAIAGKAGLGVGAGVFGAVQQGGGMVVTRTAADPARDGNGSMSVTDSMSAEAAIGVQGDLGKVRLGTVQAKAADASSKATVGTFIDFATLFNKPSECSITDKLMAALALLCGVSQVTSAGVTTIMGVVQSAIAAALSSDVEMEHITGGLSVGISGEVAGVALELAKSDKKGSSGASTVKSVSGVSIGKAGVGEKFLLSVTGYPGAGELSGKAGVQVSVSFSVLEALGYSVLGWSSADAVSAEVVVDPLNTSFERFVVTMSVPPDDRGESQETRLTVDRSVLGVAAEAAIAQLMALAPTAVSLSDQRLVIGKEFCGEILRGVVNAVSSVAIPYEHVVTQDKNPTSIEVGLGVNILGNEVDLAIKPTWGRYQSYPVERGVFVPVDKELRVGRMVKLESYPTSLFSAQVDTLPSVVVELLKVVGDILSKIWDIATGLLSSAGNTILSTGAKVGGKVLGGATTVFEKGTSILLSPFGAMPGVWAIPVAATSTKRVTQIAAPSDGTGFSVGGIYTLQPENGTLSKPASLTLNYTPAAAGVRDPGTFGIYHYDLRTRSWTPVPATHDQATRKLTAQITQLGGYCIGSDTQPPAFELLLPSGTPSIVTTLLPQLVVACRDQGAGIVPATFTASIDGNPIQADWSVAALQGTLTVVDPLADGSHVLTVQASDGTGNKGSATFSLEVRQAPAPPVLRLDNVSTGKVQLGLEAGAGGGQPTSFVIWRSEPATGIVYHRMATVKAGAGAFIDTNVRSGATYLYAATGLASADAEGPMSEPLRVTLPSSPSSGEQSGTEGSHGLSLLWLLAISFVVLLVFIIEAWVTRGRRRPPAA
ncbi:MAG: hypothetical protein WC641_01060 [Patescibacteria group bacterium]